MRTFDGSANEQKPKWPAFSLVVTTVLLAAGCAGSDPAKEDGLADCVAPTEKAHTRLVNLVEDAIWEHELFKTDKPIPKKLLVDGEPKPSAEFTDNELDTYIGWKSDNDAYEDSAQRVLNDVGDELDAMGVKGTCAS